MSVSVSELVPVQAQRIGALADAPGARLRPLPAPDSHRRGRATGSRRRGRPGRRGAAQREQHAGRGDAALSQHHAIAAIAAHHERGCSEPGGCCALRHRAPLVKARRPLMQNIET